MMRSLLLPLLIYAFSFSTFAGTKPKLEKFSKIKKNMRKTEVVKILGSPYTSRRWKGKDRWIYHFYQKKEGVIRQIPREVHFSDGIVSYTGLPPKPKLSAAKQDEENLKSDLKALKDWESHKQKAVEAREEYRQWVKEVRNKDENPNFTVPRFKSVD